MHPVCFKIGFLTIHSYGVMMAVGFLAGFLNWMLLGRREGRDSRYCSDLLFWIMLSGIVGARLAYVLENVRSFANDPISILRVDQGGLIYYGGFVGAAAALAWFARSRRDRLLSVLDFVVTSLPLGHAFGRIGCFLNGCCYGKIHEGFLSVRFPAFTLPWWHHVDARMLDAAEPYSLPVHPVQLYEAAMNLLLYAVIFSLYRRRTFEGQVTGAYLLLYPLGRFGMEFLRAPSGPSVAGLTQAQCASLVFAVLGAVLLVVARRQGRRPAARGKQE